MFEYKVTGRESCWFKPITAHIDMRLADKTKLFYSNCYVGCLVHCMSMQNNSISYKLIGHPAPIIETAHKFNAADKSRDPLY